MKTNLVLLLCCLSLMSCASETNPIAVEPAEYAWRDFYSLESDKYKNIISESYYNEQAEARAMEDCSLTHWEGTAITWTGGCVAGKRDGHGVLSWTKEINITRGQGPRKVQVMTWRFEGRFVKGQRLGLWCKTMTWQRTRAGEFVSEGTLNGCSIMGGSTKPLTGEYRKQSDGSWMEYRNESPTGQSLAAGVLEAQSAKVLAEAAAGKTDLAVNLHVHSRSLDDLVRGSKIVLATSTEPLMLNDKRVAVVLSTQTVGELERFTRERQALLEASAGLRGEAAKARTSFIQASDPGRLLLQILTVVRQYAKEAHLADDLSELKGQSVDYALVVDWRSLSRLDLLGTFDSFVLPWGRSFDPYVLEAQVMNGSLSPLFAESLSGFLINRDLQAVKQFKGVMNVYNPPLKPEKTGDHAYFDHLTSYFSVYWGPSSLSTSMYELNKFLKP